jgi:two-component system CheB/CheR fusion protein
VLPRIFDAFGQDGHSRQPGGLGISLAISRGIVNMHGGTIEATSPGTGQGATFTVTLPLSTPARKRTVATVTGRRPAARVLLVEDHHDTAQVMMHVLRRLGYSVQHADSVGAAVHAATNQDFDLLVSDLGLPDGTGHELIRQLLKSRRISGGIALSGYGMEEDIRRSHEAGFAAHLTKPVNLAQLTHTLDSLVGSSPQLAATASLSPANPD